MEPASILSIENVIQEIESNKDEILSSFGRKLKEQLALPKDIKPTDLVEVVPKQLELLISALIRCSASGSSVNTLAIEHARLRSSKTFSSSF